LDRLSFLEYKYDAQKPAFSILLRDTAVPANLDYLRLDTVDFITTLKQQLFRGFHSRAEERQVFVYDLDRTCDILYFLALVAPKPPI
jgi:hypothetical protein